MTSGASAAATVPRLSRMSPKFLVTTLMVAPFEEAQSFATLVTAAARSESVQMTICTALWRAPADEAALAASGATTPSSAHMRMSEFCIKSLSLLGDETAGRLGAGTGTSVEPLWGKPQRSFYRSLQTSYAGMHLSYARRHGRHPRHRAEDGRPGAPLPGGARPPRAERRFPARDHVPRGRRRGPRRDDHRRRREPLHRLRGRRRLPERRPLAPAGRPGRPGAARPLLPHRFHGRPPRGLRHPRRE